MNLLFFGESSRQLFGAYHAPPPTRPAVGAALLCAPWGQEYLVSHRTNRRLAARLAERGYHVMRFDYFGTGDSAGNRSDGDLHSWLRDARTAMAELRDMSGISSVATFGVRLGAVIAWRLAVESKDVTSTVLWDPVVNGSEYLRELNAAQQEMQRWTLTSAAPRELVPGMKTLLGFPMTPAMRASIEEITAHEYAKATRASVRVFYSDAKPDDSALVHSLRSVGTPFHSEAIPGQTPWRDDEAAGTTSVAVSVLERMVDLLA